MRHHSFVVFMLAPAMARAASTCSSGLSKGALAGIVVEGVVIAILLLVLLIVLRRSHRTAHFTQPDRSEETKATYQSDHETRSLRRQSSRSSTVDSMPDEVNAYPLATPRVDFVPTILRPRSLTLSSPPSVRSSMLYAFSPTPEQSRPSTAYEHSKPQNNLRVPLHIPSASEVTLPNPHSEHGHDALVESPVDIPLPPPARLVTAPSYPGQPPAVPPSMSHSELSSAEDAVYSLERGPTPISQHSTMSVMLDDPDRYVNVHDLLLGRQLGSDAHLLGRDSPKTSPLEVSHAAGHQ